MKLVDQIEKLFTRILPSPFTIAVILTLLSMSIATIFCFSNSKMFLDKVLIVLEYWEQGLWTPPLLVFAMQMMLMLVLGHVLALSKPINKVIEFMTKYSTNTPKAAFWVCLLTLIVSLCNWGLGLIFGAIFARKVAENAKKKNWRINYPLIGACGYSGLMVWHGGLSGSAPLKASEVGHLKSLMKEIYDADQISQLPNQITFADTVFSSMNIAVSLTILLVMPCLMYYIGSKIKSKPIQLKLIKIQESNKPIKGAERLDHSKFLAFVLGLGIIGFASYKAIFIPKYLNLNFISPNFINFTLLGLCITLHGNFYKFIKAIQSAIGGTSGILIQFPLYFGIMGIMKHSGMVLQISDFFASFTSLKSFSIFTFFSASIVNIFIPSGGGQWAIQAPILIEACQQLGISISKNIMAMAYGDQITNMLQPFWALPLLGITGLNAKEILPFTLIIMLIGTIIFLSGLLIF